MRVHEDICFLRCIKSQFMNGIGKGTSQFTNGIGKGTASSRAARMPRKFELSRLRFARVVPPRIYKYPEVPKCHA